MGEGRKEPGPYIAIAVAGPEIDLGKNPPVASSSSLPARPPPSSLLPLGRAAGDGRRAGRRSGPARLEETPRLCFCFNKKKPNPSARL